MPNDRRSRDEDTAAEIASRDALPDWRDEYDPRDDEEEWEEE